MHKRMLPYCLKCRKNIESKNHNLEKQKPEEQRFYQTVRSMVVKNQDCFINKKLVEY